VFYSVSVVRDSDKKVLAQAVFEVGNDDQRKRAFEVLWSEINASIPEGVIDPPTFTFRFEGTHAVPEGLVA
jgi:hypothetical protein